METPGFDTFIGDMFSLYNRVVKELVTNRQHVIAAGQRALTVLRNYQPADDGEEILIETAIEQFEDLVREAGGTP